MQEGKRPMPREIGIGRLYVGLTDLDSRSVSYR